MDLPSDQQAKRQVPTEFHLLRGEWIAILAAAVLCSIGAAVSGRMLYDELQGAGNRGLGSPLAQVDRSDRKVRRKPGNSFVWTYVREREPLFRKDSVQTSAGSAASIQFKDGSKLEIGENSLIVIDDIANLALNFKQGTVVLKDKEGNDTQITVDKEGKKKVEKLLIRLTAPENLSERWVAQNGISPVQFEWEQRSGKFEPGNYKLEVSTERSFRVGATQAIEARNFESKRALSVPLAPGAYFWRITRNGQALTTTGRFRLLPAAALKPTFPAADQKIVTFGEQVPVQFRWINNFVPDSGSDHGDERPNASVEHRIEVATDPQFKAMSVSQKLAAGATQLQLKLPYGHYYWRLSSRLGSLQVTSPVLSFTSEIGKRFVIRQSFPEDRTTHEALPQMRLAWMAEGGADALQYEWQVRDAQGKALASARTPSNSASLKSPPPGSYQWRVLAINTKGETLGESPWRTFTLYSGKPLGLLQPPPDDKILYWEQPTEFAFKWDPDSAIADGTYEMELSKEASFQPPLLSRATRETTLTSTALKLEPGTYHWRVRVRDKEGNLLKTSAARLFTYGLHPTLPPPQALMPAAQREYNLREKDFEATFGWSPVPEATQYDFTVYRLEKTRAPAGSKGAITRKVVHHSTTRDTKRELADLPPGDYQWTLRSFDQKKRPGEPMVPRSFRIIEGATLDAPEDISVEVE